MSEHGFDAVMVALGLVVANEPLELITVGASSATTSARYRPRNDTAVATALRGCARAG
jgi:hypothetical protein